MQTEPVREKLFTMRMSAEEWERAETLSGHYGLTVAALFRMMLKDKQREVNEAHGLAARGQPGMSPRLPTKASTTRRRAKAKR